MTIVEILAAVGAGISTIASIVGGGFLTKTLNHMKETAAENAVLRYRLDKIETDLKSDRDSLRMMITENAVISSKITTFEAQLKKLDLIPDIAAKLEATVDTIHRLHEVVDSLAAHRGE